MDCPSPTSPSAPDATLLIVTADDFGASPRRNAGIVAAWRHGIVTGTSLLANGPAFADAIQLAKDHDIPLGIHLNLADYRALGGVVPGLTDSQGFFLGKIRSRQALAAGSFDQTALHRELRTQIARVTAAGITPQALDSHQHAHLFPAVMEVIIDLAHSFNLRVMRNPLPAEPADADPSGPLGEELALYRRLAPACASSLHRAGLIAPDGLYGMPLLNRLDEPALLQILDRLPPGIWELMSHPGYRDPHDPFGEVEREREIAALTSQRLRQHLADRKISLITFNELNPPCAS